MVDGVDCDDQAGCAKIAEALWKSLVLIIFEVVIASCSVCLMLQEARSTATLYTSSPKAILVCFLKCREYFVFPAKDGSVTPPPEDQSRSHVFPEAAHSLRETGALRGYDGHDQLFKPQQLQSYLVAFWQVPCIRELPSCQWRRQE